MSTQERIRFVCPVCEASHERGMVDGAALFRCLRCGYMGFGHHADEDMDIAIEAERRENNEVNRALGLPEVPPGYDPLNGPG